MIAPHVLRQFRLRRRWCYLAIAGVTLLLSLGLTRPTPATGTSAPAIAPLAQAQNPAQLAALGQAEYAQGDYGAAIAAFQQAATLYEQQGQGVQAAAMWGNVCLSEQQRGRWAEAETAIARALPLLPAGDAAAIAAVRAQVLTIQGQLQFARGQVETAALTWEHATTAYQQAGDAVGALKNQVNQAQALQSAGYYRRSLSVLTDVVTALQTEPDSELGVVARRQLGEALRVTGALERSQLELTASLEMAQRLRWAEGISAAYRSLGDLKRAQGEPSVAVVEYTDAIATAPTPLSRFQARLSQLSALVELGRWAEVQTLLPMADGDIAALPPTRSALYARLNFIQQVVSLQRQLPDQIATANPSAVETLQAVQQILPDRRTLATAIAAARQEANQLGDQRAEAYLLGSLAELYADNDQGEMALTLSRQALALSRQTNATDLAYRWQEQVGRFLKAEGDLDGAIAAYTESVNTLQSLRQDLVAVSSDLQFSFRKDVEPIYRELVTLLLTAYQTTPQDSTLQAARDVIEKLQLAELDNFFREACLDAQPVRIDQVDDHAAVVYPIILGDRLDVVISFPDRTFAHHSLQVTADMVRTTANQLQQALSIRPPTETEQAQRTSPSAVILNEEPVNASLDYLPLAQQIYDWLIRPSAAAIAQADLDTLVFVLDGALRNIPMAVLHDGTHFLIEDYAIALTPGLQLLDAQPLGQRPVRAIVAGLSESREARSLVFSELPSVEKEVSTIQALVPSRVLLNEEFRSAAFTASVESTPFPVVHLATHGQFSSNPEDTFILTWDGVVNAQQLSTLLQSSELTRGGAVELLILSACQTAAGDDRASLGLAGVAVRSGARSTLATLWLVDDAGTSEFMTELYQGLSAGTLSKAKVLQQAQLQLLTGAIPGYAAPYYWAPFVLVGNWL